MIGFILDMDGVLYRGSEPIPGSAEGLARLRAMGRVVFLTNNATLTRGGFASKARGLGFDIDADEVVTSAYATACVLSGKVRSCLVVGESGLVEELRVAGLEVHTSLRPPEPASIDAVVVGLDRAFTYRKLADAAEAVRAGATLWGTNPDRTLPEGEALAPGAGAILAAVEAASGASATVVGKPEPLAVRIAVEVLGLPPDRCVVVGDRLDTDVEGGRRAGCRTALVLTGVSTRGEAERLGAAEGPTWVCEDLLAFAELIGREEGRS